MATKLLALAALLVGCAADPNARPTPDQFRFRSSSSTQTFDRPSDPPVYTPTPNIAGPSGGISKRCVPEPSGLGADCTPL